MTDSATARAFQQVLRFNETNWENWSFSAKAVLLFLSALRIADRTETRPTDAMKIKDYNKWAHQGLSLILTYVDIIIY